MDFNVIDIGYQPSKKRKILVVDDEIAVQSLFHDSFHEGYVLLAAYTAKEGMDLAEHVNPDLIFMDIMLPDMNGYDAIKQLGANMATRKIPVLVITARDFDPSTIKLIKSEPNVVGFANKPFSVKGLRKAVEDIFHHFEK